MCNDTKTIAETYAENTRLKKRIKEGVQALADSLSVPSETIDTEKYTTLEELMKAVADMVKEKKGVKRKGGYTLYGISMTLKEIAKLFGLGIIKVTEICRGQENKQVELFMKELLSVQQLNQYTRNGEVIHLHTLAEETNLSVSSIYRIFSEHGTTEYTDVPSEKWQKREYTDDGKKKQVSKSNYSYNGVPIKLTEVAEELEITPTMLRDCLKKYETTNVEDIPKTETLVWWKEYTYTYKGRKINIANTAYNMGISLKHMLSSFEEGNFELTSAVVKQAKSKKIPKYQYDGRDISLTEVCRILQAHPTTVKKKCELYGTTDITHLIKTRKLWEERPSLLQTTWM